MYSFGDLWPFPVLWLEHQHPTYRYHRHCSSRVLMTASAVSWLWVDLHQTSVDVVQPLGHRPSSSIEGSGLEVDFGGKVTPGQGNDDAASSIHHHEADMSNTTLIRVRLLLSGSYEFYVLYSWKEIQVLTQSCKRPWWRACECLKSDYYHSTIVVQLLIIFLSAFLMTLPSFWFSLTFTLSRPVLSPLFFLFAHIT